MNTDRRNAVMRVVGAAAVVLIVAGLLAVAAVRRHEDSPRIVPRGGDTTSPPAVDDKADALSFDGTARSLVTDAPIVGLASVTLDAGSLSGVGRVTAADGRDLGEGTLSASGPALSARGGGAPDLGLSAPIRIVKGTVRTTGDGRVTGATQFTLGGTLSFALAPKSGSSGTKSPPTTAAPVAISPGARIKPTNGYLDVHGTAAWTDAPARLTLAGDKLRHDLSWAGTGHVTGGGVNSQATYTGLRVFDVDATIGRAGASVTVTGKADVAQVYADGVPLLRTTATVGVLHDAGGVFRTPEALQVAAGQRGRFIWAPRNTGRVDMNILRIRPASADAAWVALRLETTPPMWGGEPHAGVGGDTTGLSNKGTGGLFGPRRAAPIDATLGAGKADRREIAFDVPASAAKGPHVLALILEGNFEPMRVEVTVAVT